MRLIRLRPEWNEIVELAMTTLGLAGDRVQELLMLLITTMKARGDSRIRAKELITVLTRLNVGKQAARRHVRKSCWICALFRKATCTLR